MEAPNAQDKYDHTMDQPHMEDDSMYGGNNNNDTEKTFHEEQPEETNKDHSETAAAELLVRQERAKMTADAGQRLEAVLQQIKAATKKLLAEFDVYMEAVEGVTIDYIRCQHSQRKEASRLEEVEPDVEGATARLFQQAQDQLAAGVTPNTNME